MSTMNRALILLSVVVLALAAAQPADAQTRPDIVVETLTVKVKPGERQQWKAAYKRFHAWEHQHNYPFSSTVFSIAAGEGTGQYIVTRFGPSWSDFDKIGKFDSSIDVGKEIGATVGPYTDSVEREFYLEEPNFTLGRITEHAPAPFQRVVRLSLKPGSVPAVTGLIRQMNVAIKKTKWPGGRGAWFELAEGEGPQLLMINGLGDWAALQSPTLSLRAVLVKVYGKAHAGALVRELDGHLLSVNGQVLRYRPDLSYTASTP